jgi:hypothetical protein
MESLFTPIERNHLRELPQTLQTYKARWESEAESQRLGPRFPPGFFYLFVILCLVDLRRRKMKTIERRPVDFTDLAQMVSTHYPFTRDTHSRLKRHATTNQVIPEAIIQHCLNHLNKSTIGPIAGVLEAYDHGAEFDRYKVIEAMAKALVNMQKIAETMGISLDEVLQVTPEAMGVKVQND